MCTKQKNIKKISLYNKYTRELSHWKPLDYGKGWLCHIAKATMWRFSEIDSPNTLDIQQFPHCHFCSHCPVLLLLIHDFPHVLCVCPLLLSVILSGTDLCPLLSDVDHSFLQETRKVHTCGSHVIPMRLTLWSLIWQHWHSSSDRNCQTVTKNATKNHFWIQKLFTGGAVHGCHHRQYSTCQVKAENVQMSVGSLHMDDLEAEKSIYNNMEGAYTEKCISVQAAVPLCWLSLHQRILMLLLRQQQYKAGWGYIHLDQTWSNVSLLLCLFWRVEPAP